MGSRSRSLTRRGLLAVAAATLVSTPLLSQTYDFSAATALLDAFSPLYAGGVYVLVVQNDRAIFEYRSEGGPTEDGQIRLASASKWLSSAVVLRLAERGVFDLDDRIGEYLPIFDLYGKGDVTLRQAFSMTSGLSETEVDYETSPFLTLELAANLIAVHTPIVFPPGTQLDYEGDGMEVVGRVAEVATGRDWRTLVEEEIVQPLGLESLDYDLFPVNPGIPGGARATPADYQQFLRMVLRDGRADDGTRYLAPESVREWFTNRTHGLPEYHSAWPPYPYPYGERPDYGHGSWIQAQNPASGRVEEVASPGKFGTYPWVDAKRRLRAIVATDSANGFAETVYVDLALLDALRSAIDEVFLFADDFESGDFVAWFPPVPPS